MRPLRLLRVLWVLRVSRVLRPLCPLWPVWPVWVVVVVLLLLLLRHLLLLCHLLLCLLVLHLVLLHLLQRSVRRRVQCRLHLPCVLRAQRRQLRAQALQGALPLGDLHLRRFCALFRAALRHTCVLQLAP